VAETGDSSKILWYLCVKTEENPEHGICLILTF